MHRHIGEPSDEISQPEPAVEGVADIGGVLPRPFWALGVINSFGRPVDLVRQRVRPSQSPHCFGALAVSTGRVLSADRDHLPGIIPAPRRAMAGRRPATAWPA